MPGATPELKFHIVRAGAGAGKTRGLVEKVVEVFRHFQAQGLAPRIVVTTFTRKATQELKERLILKACRERDPQLLQFVSDPNKLHISTIHGLLNVFLRQVGHLAGLDAGFQLVNGGEGGTMARLALRESILRHPEGLRWLEVYGFNRVLAMCRRYETATREQGGLKPGTIEDMHQAAARETQAWKNELGELSAEILEEVDDPKWVEFAQGLQAFLIRWTGNCTELDLMPKKPRRSSKNEAWEAWHERVEDTLKQFKKEMDRPCWNQDLWPEMVKAWNDFAPLAEDYVTRVSAMKEQQARFELADLELKTVEILRDKPFLGTIFSENWDFWMIDEYQDTSPLQVACLQALIGDKPTYFVGDPQQSIYLFRGAEVKVFDEAERFVEGRGGVRVELRRNYRSEPDLLHWINDFMASVSPAFQSMEPREAPAAVCRDCVTLLRAPDEAEELNAIVHRIQCLIQEGASLEKICVLGRTHRTLMEVSAVLRERGFPTHVHAARGFGLRREVVDAQAVWKFLVNPHDNLNLLVLLRSPWFYVEDARLAEWMKDRPHSLWRKLNGMGDKVPQSILRLREAEEKLNRFGLARTFEETLSSAAYLDLSLVNDPAGRKESNLWKLIHKARALEKEGGQSVLNFLEKEAGADQLDITEGDATSAQEPNCINLMTIHGSKGLEFDHVIIPHMGEPPRTSNVAQLEAENGRFFFPLWNEEDGEFVASPLDQVKVREQRARELAEFDRWLYVALTRAKSTLTLSWSKVGRDSWAARSTWFTRAAGVHESQFYRYLLREEKCEPVRYEAAQIKHRKLREPWRKPAAKTEARHSVTELVSARKRGGGEDLLKRWQAQNLGTKIHKALEALKYQNATPPDEAESAVRYVLSLKKPDISQMIRDGEAEWGFQVKTPTQVVEGQIDLWAKWDGKLYVVDYKSGSDKYKEEAFEQLALYAWALRKFGHTEPAELIVIYPLDEKFEARPFTPELFAHWENKFGGSQA